MSYFLEDKLPTKLKEITGLAHYNNNRSELIVRCPLPGCELEEGKTKHGRMYIDTKDPVFHCFRCQRSGSIFKLLKFLKLDPTEYIDVNQVRQYKPSKVRTEDFKFNSQSVFSLDTVNEVYTSKVYQDKVQYLKCRLGQDVNLEKIPGLIFNITEFINKNNIKLNRKDQTNLNWYDTNFIGFLGILGNILILRCVNNASQDSYHKVYLGQQGHYKDFYGIKIGAIKKDETNKIILMEGTFDLLLGCRIEETKEIRSGCCYAACGFGSNYPSLVKSVLTHLKLPQVDVVVFSDKDKHLDDIVYKKMKEDPRIRRLEMFYNKSGHDFGDNPITPTCTSFTPDGFFKKRKYEKKQVRQF